VSMTEKQSSVELNWIELLEQGYVFGIPCYFNGAFLSNTHRKDINSIRKGYIQRFPITLRQKIPYLFERSICTTGIRIEFMTDAMSMQVVSKISKLKHRENYSNMGQASLDIMVDGKLWMNFYPKWEDPDKIYLKADGQMHRICMVLPNYAGARIRKIILHDVTKVSQKSPPYLLENRPIVYYGSSITQGGCASRPALAYSHRLSETFCANYINLSISGNARGEPEIAEYVASFSHAIMFILDWGANLLEFEDDGLLEQRYEHFWRTIHNHNPDTPILFIGLQNFGYDVYSEPKIRDYIQQKRNFIQKQALEACEEINQSRKRKIFDYIDGTSIINTNSLELTIDGTHPSDAGHKTYAELLEWKIIDLLGNHIGD
jgi:lysophospholipase L1-like esterase